jgi:hypothetical protein
VAEAISPRGFNVYALYDALDERRRDQGLSWPGVAKAVWELSADLNDRRRDHPIAAATFTGMAKRGNISCQHALFMLRWLDRAPEEFIADPHPETRGVPLPTTDTAHRLRWNLVAMYEALNAERTSRELTWAQAAQSLHCTPSQLTGLRTARFGTGMRLAMRICQSLGRPAADFVNVARW